MKENREASIYERRGALFIRGSAKTDTGLWIEKGPCTTLPSSAAPSELGQAARDALDRSGEIIPHPTVWKSVDEDNPILEQAGIRRWSTFRKGARVVGLSLYDGKLALTPSENEGSEGFAHLDDDALYLPPDADPAELGAAIKQALKRCK